MIDSLWLLWRALSRQKRKCYLNGMCIYAFEEERWSLHLFRQAHFAAVASCMSLTVRLEARDKHLSTDHTLLSITSVFLIIEISSLGLGSRCWQELGCVEALVWLTCGYPLLTSDLRAAILSLHLSSHGHHSLWIWYSNLHFLKGHRRQRIGPRRGFLLTYSFKLLSETSGLQTSTCEIWKNMILPAINTE